MREVSIRLKWRLYAFLAMFFLRVARRRIRRQLETTGLLEVGRRGV